MDIKELRVGNIVRLKDHFVGGNAMVTGIMKDRITAVNSVGTNIGTINIMYVEPIPITEQLLLKIGFEKNSFGWWRLDKRNDKFMIKGYSQISTFEYWNEVHNPEDVTETNYGSTIELPYKIHLHTLQNIWYLLTGKELEIEL